MKRTLYILLSLVCMLSACSKDEGGFVKDEFGRISQTLTIPSGMPENVAVFYNKWNPDADDQYYTGVQAAVPASVGKNGTYGFEINSIDGAESYNYFFLSPYKSTLTRSIYQGNSVVKARLFSVQYPSSEGVDANYDYKIGVNAENIGPGEEISSDQWKSIICKLELDLSDPENILQGCALSAVTLEFEEASDVALVGMFMTRHSSRLEECGFIGVDENACGKGLSLLYPSGLQPVSGSYPLHFATLPCSVSAGTKGTLSVSTPARTVSFEFTLASDLLLESEAQLTLTLDASHAAYAEKSTQIQFFTDLQTNTMSLSQTTAAGETYRWGFSSCSRYKDEYGLPVALKMVQNSSISLPHPEGKTISGLKVYTHEDSYNSPLNDSDLILKNMGKPQQTYPCGHYNTSLYDGGCFEFEGLDDMMSRLSLAVEFSDEGVYHQVPVSAILMELEDGEYKEDTSGEIDYYELYKGGDEIVIGDMTISLAKNGEAKLIKPSNLTYVNMSDGGIYILDDSEGQTVRPDFGTATTKNIAAKDNLVIMGRYGNSGIQTCLEHCELRMNSPYSVTFFNIGLSYVPANNTSSQAAFARNSSDANHSTLRFVDCNMDYSTLVGSKTGYYLVFASNGANGYFENVIIDNCIVKMTSETGKTPVIYYNNRSRSGGTFVDEKITVKNSVICTAAPMNGYLIWSGNDSSYPTPFLSVDVQNCTFAGLHNEKGIFRASELQSMKVCNNVFYSDTSASTYLWLIYSGTATEGNYVINDNKFYNLTDASKWKLYLPDNKISPTESGNEMSDGVPFAAGYDLSAGYVPVDPAVVGTGVGASYETKRYITKPVVQE